MRSISYYFARISHLNQVKVKSKSDYLLKGIASKAVIERRGFHYKFIQIGKTTFEGSSFLYGYLVKYDPAVDEETIDEKTSSFQIATIDNKVNAKCHFIIHPDSSVIMFHEDVQNLRKTSFYEIFSELFETNYDNMFVQFRIDPLLDKYAFLEEVKKFISVKKVTIDLVPSNPHYADRWQRIDERLKKANVSNYKEVLENKRDGEGIIIDDEVENGFLMSEDGYGESKVEGITDKGERVITTKKNNKQIKVKASNTGDLVTVLTQLRATLQEIINRADGVQ